MKPDLDQLYDYVTGDEDARVCRDIPAAACRHQPRNFFAYLLANLLSVALAPPYYILLAQAHTGGGVQGLGWLVVAAGLGASISSPFWGRMGDRSSRTVMALAAGGAGVLGLATVAASWPDESGPVYTHALTRGAAAAAPVPIPAPR